MKLIKYLISKALNQYNSGLSASGTGAKGMNVFALPEQGHSQMFTCGWSCTHSDIRWPWWCLTVVTYWLKWSTKRKRLILVWGFFKLLHTTRFIKIIVLNVVLFPVLRLLLLSLKKIQGSDFVFGVCFISYNKLSNWQRWHKLLFFFSFFITLTKNWICILWIKCSDLTCWRLKKRACDTLKACIIFLLVSRTWRHWQEIWCIFF